MPTTEESDWPDLYAALQARVLAQLAELSPQQAAIAVDACPGWSVKDVMSHVSGLVAETLANVPLPRGSVEGTARQVADRANWSLADVCNEWQNNADAFTEYGRGNGAYAAALTSDLVVHFFDIADAVGLDIETDAEPAGQVATRYGGTLQGRVAEALDVALTLRLDGELLAPPNPDATQALGLTTTAYDFLRSVTSRRTRSQVEQLDWTGDPSQVLSGPWAQYGPLRD